jgi:hypothetical protein
MTMKRVLGALLLLLACGPGADTPTARPPRPAAQDPQVAEERMEKLRESFVWGDASQPAGDWDADAEACKGRVDEDSSVPKGAHALVRVAAFIQCMDDMGWASKGQNR